MDLLYETGMHDYKPTLIVAERGHELKEQWDNTPTNRLRYQKLVEKN